MKSIGIYPGTFDPIHEGHVAFANAAIAQCGLDEVYFVPEHKPRGKTNVRDLQERVAIIRETLNQTSDLNIITLASKRFTVHETLPGIESRFGPANFTLLVGSDVAMTLAKWPNCDRMLKKWSLAVGIRHDDKPEDIDAVLEGIERAHRFKIRRAFIRTAKASVSSSQLRNVTK